jgi:hypothetical protein
MTGYSVGITDERDCIKYAFNMASGDILSFVGSYT